ncbi:MAG: phosphate ABC transporter permease PstA [Chitinophagales bacterium]|nr:phosphate ABC transporter permease PstA [Chitinophagales bacterium]MDW8428418.1 phosphate ABC transporter permease PstA [Chitinophagales bacterium]
MEHYRRHALKQRLYDTLFQVVALAGLLFAVMVLMWLLYTVFEDGIGRLNKQFLTSFPSRRAEEAGILAGMVGSVLVVLLTIVIAVPLGIGAAIYLEEYGRKNWFSRFIELNIANLAGVPSIVYGLLGLGLFVRWMQLDRSLIAGALTLSLLIMPVIIISAREALRSVPPGIREASFAMGATRWQTIWHHLLPISFPSILTGIILAVSRAIGETAPLITIGALTFVTFLPDDLRSPFTILPIQIFNWISRPQAAFHENAAAGIIVLLCITLLLNATAIYLRNRFSR